MSHYMVDCLQVCDPDALPWSDLEIRLTVDWNPDNMGFPTAEVRAHDFDTLVSFCREVWGDDDAEWFDRYVVGRIMDIGVPMGRAGLYHFGPIDVESQCFMRKVEDEWYYETKGEISLIPVDDPTGYDVALRETVVAMAKATFDVLDSDVAQFDRSGNEIEGPFGADLVASRIARSLVVLFYGSDG